MSKKSLKLSDYEEYYDSVKEDKVATAKIKANEIREKNVNNTYDQIERSAANAYKDSVAKVDRQKSQAMQDANALNERLARYIPEVNQRMGAGGTGTSDTLTLEMYAEANRRRQGISDTYDTQKIDMLKAYQDAATARELERASKLDEIEISNIEALAAAATAKEEKEKVEEETKDATQKNNLGALGQGVIDGSVSFKDYADYYNKVSGDLDDDEDLALKLQYDEIIQDQYWKAESNDSIGMYREVNGKEYVFDMFGDGKVREVRDGDVKKVGKDIYKYENGQWKYMGTQGTDEKELKAEEILKMQGKWGSQDPNYFYVP